MAFFKFTGDPKTGHGPQAIPMFDKVFGRYSGTEVTDEAQIKKLRGNPHFAEVSDGDVQAQAPRAEPIADEERERMNAAFDRLHAAKDAADRAAFQAQEVAKEASEQLAAAIARAEAAEARATKAEADLLEALTDPNKGGDGAGSD